jgi:hypothetical protein
MAGFGAVVQEVMRLLRRLPGVVVEPRATHEDGKSGGPFAHVATTRRSMLRIEVWFDRYIDRTGPQRPSIWLVAEPDQKAALGRVAKAWKRFRANGHKIDAPRRSPKHYVRPGADLLDAGILDVWGNANYLGVYLRECPPTREGARMLVEEMKVLVELAEQLAAPDDANRPDKTVRREIRLRQGQQKFRLALGRAFGWRCAVTATAAWAVLEAAHIVPHQHRTNYGLENGLLLRADIHTLFDKHLITIDGQGTVHVAEELRGTEYAAFDGKRLRCRTELIAERRDALIARRRREG